MSTRRTLSVVAIVAAVVLPFVWLAGCAPERDRPAAAAGVAERTPEVESPAPPAAEPEPAAQPSPASPPSGGARPTERGAVELVKNWVGAWSEQRVEDYLDCYARTFVPEDDLSRREWEARRRDRIAAPRFVRVQITGLEVELTEIGSARATFLQHYRSDGYTDTVRKTLDLVWEDGRWRIERERSAGALEV